MTPAEEAQLHPFIIGARVQMRFALGLRPETRLDEIIFPDGAVFHEMPNGVFCQVRGEPVQGVGWMP